MQRFDSRRLREIRESQGKSREGVGVALNLSYPTIAAYETGNATPTIDNLIRLADELGVPVGDLFTEAVEVMAS